MRENTVFAPRARIVSKGLLSAEELNAEAVEIRRSVLVHCLHSYSVYLLIYWQVPGCLVRVKYNSIQHVFCRKQILRFLDDT